MKSKIVSGIVGGLLLGAITTITAIKIKIRKNEVEEWEN